jgi:hypothetical protein
MKGVAVGVGVFVAVGVRVGVAVLVGVGVSVGVAVFVGVGVIVGVSVGVAVLVGVFVGAGVSVGVLVAVFVGVFVAVAVAVFVGVGVTVAVDVAVGVGVDANTVVVSVSELFVSLYSGTLFSGSTVAVLFTFASVAVVTKPKMLISATAAGPVPNEPRSQSTVPPVGGPTRMQVPRVVVALV